MSTGENDWIFDAIYEFFQSARWQTPVQSFIEEHCVEFLNEDCNTQDHKNIHKRFTKLIDKLMQTLLGEIGINQKQFLTACHTAKNNKNHWKIVKQILLVENFEEFKKIMIKRNKDIERKALSLMLQNEERAMKNLLNKKKTGPNYDHQAKRDAARNNTTGGQQQNSFSSGSGSDSEDEGMKLALKMSMDEEKQRKSHKQMSDMNEQVSKNDMQNMMMDTAGFQKVLMMSKKEEEQRLAKQEAQYDEQEAQIKNSSLIDQQKNDKREQALIDAEEAQLQAALALSSAYHREESNKMGQMSKDELQEQKELELQRKNQELLDRMALLEQDKDSHQKTAEEMKENVENMRRAMEQMEADKKAHKEQDITKNMDNEQKDKLADFKKQMIEAKAEERKEDLMRTTFMKMNIEEVKMQENIEMEKQRQAEVMEQKKLQRQESQKKVESSDDEPAIDEDYDGFGDVAEPKSKILDKEFLSGLADDLDFAAVPDSDDEMYF